MAILFANSVRAEVKLLAKKGRLPAFHLVK